MATNAHQPENSNLADIVKECLFGLEALSLSLQTYGNEVDAANLRAIIDKLRNGTPAEVTNGRAPVDFVVKDTFKVSRQQVANVLWQALYGQEPWCKIVKKKPPHSPLRFRSIIQTAPGHVDYPLNEGGAITIAVSLGQESQECELRLEVLARGLEVLAAGYPRHFTDLVHDNIDDRLANLFIQCCVFGELRFD